VIPEEVHATAVARLLATPGHDGPRPRLESHGNHVFGVLVVPAEAADRRQICYKRSMF
jgi:hypothetical protein